MTIKKEVFDKAGLPQSEFFIYGDDYEHAIRVVKLGEIVCVPAIVVNHRGNNSSIKEVSWRDYYETRNHLWICKNYFGNVSFFIRIFMRKLTALWSGNKVKQHIYNVAISDAKNNKLGVHTVYKPGWRAKE